MLVIREARYALRAMRRAPAFTAAAIATLALAIGVNSAIFAVVDRLLLRPLPYRDADRLVTLDATREIAGASRPRPVSWPIDAADRWRDAMRPFASMTYYASSVVQLSGRGGAELLDGATVAPSFFSTLDGAIVAGRAFGDADGRAPSIVVSERLARRLFNGKTAAVGAHLVLNSTDDVVIGVAAAGWDVPSAQTDVWEPAPFAQARNARCCAVQLLARLHPGVTIGRARAGAADAARRLAQVDSETFGRIHPTMVTLRDRQLGEVRTTLLLLWAAVAIVLVMACGNVVNLLVARNIARARELSIRRALGASRRRLVSHGLIESAILTAGGVAGGLVVGQSIATVLLRVAGPVFPRLHDLALDVRVVLFAGGLGVLATLATGLVPAIEAANVAPPRTTAAAASVRQRRLQRLLCAAQLAAAAVLIVSAILLGRSLVDLLRTDLGVTPDHVVTASINTAFGRAQTADGIARTIWRSSTACNGFRVWSPPGWAPACRPTPAAWRCRCAARAPTSTTWPAPSPARPGTSTPSASAC